MPVSPRLDLRMAWCLGMVHAGKVLGPGTPALGLLVPKDGGWAQRSQGRPLTFWEIPTKSSPLTSGKNWTEAQPPWGWGEGEHFVVSCLCRKKKLSIGDVGPDFSSRHYKHPP